MGLKDWVWYNADDYLACAVKYAAMSDYLKTLRYEIPSRLSSSAVGNNVMYTRAVEAAYRKMWVDYCRGAAEQSAPLSKIPSFHCSDQRQNPKQTARV